MKKTTCDVCGKVPYFDYFSTVKRVNKYSSTNEVEFNKTLELCIDCFEEIENAAYQKYLELTASKEA